MNQEIREIRLLLGIACKDMTGTIETNSEQLEQFAKAIINRCSQVCQENYRFSGLTLANMLLEEFESD